MLCPPTLCTRRAPPVTATHFPAGNPAKLGDFLLLLLFLNPEIFPLLEIPDLLCFFLPCPSGSAGFESFGLFCREFPLNFLYMPPASTPNPPAPALLAENFWF
ncbi:hypothetical protein SLEP1_g22661 [Rubroshorea leprosula]|uniref:Uncharacterized protein n=1 Tax=Rubroshorea leprosula TaxID=152421 RepID=A0AAV5JFX3_9ROSI|nr:hypothetical protein SLEP1_g22661 [Rubroshorea leprosula]